MKQLILLMFFAALAFGQARNVKLTVEDAVNPPSTQYKFYAKPGKCADPGQFTALNEQPKGKEHTDNGVAIGSFKSYQATAVIPGFPESGPSPCKEVAIGPAPPGLTAEPEDVVATIRLERGGKVLEAKLTMPEN